jgi:hypothetical protein
MFVMRGQKKDEAQKTVVDKGVLNEVGKANLGQRLRARKMDLPL